jgi:diadenosine tetraphosphate (Ap4A) HIT family hydrolase
VCAFCRLVAAGDELLECSEYAAAFLDGFPSTPGHLLVVPRRHVARLDELSLKETADLWDLVMRRLRVMAPGCDAVNVGVNDGPAAGQTIGHVHVHLIPRRSGDVADPRGGVRWVIPATADYWSSRS